MENWSVRIRYNRCTFPDKATPKGNIEQGTRNIESRSKGRFKFVFHFVIRYSLFRVRYSLSAGLRKGPALYYEFLHRFIFFCSIQFGKDAFVSYELFFEEMATKKSAEDEDENPGNNGIGTSDYAA